MAESTACPGDVPTSSSIMPKGLLDSLSREEALDLVAFVIARGEAANPLFPGQDDHGH